MGVDTDVVTEYDRLMLELLAGRPSDRLVVTMPPQMKRAVIEMADASDQDASQLVRHLIAAEAARRAQERDQTE